MINQEELLNKLNTLGQRNQISGTAYPPVKPKPSRKPTLPKPYLTHRNTKDTESLRTKQNNQPKQQEFVSPSHQHERCGYNLFYQQNEQPTQQPQQLQQWHHNQNHCHNHHQPLPQPPPQLDGTNRNSENGEYYENFGSLMDARQLRFDNIKHFPSTPAAVVTSQHATSHFHPPRPENSQVTYPLYKPQQQRYNAQSLHQSPLVSQSTFNGVNKSRRTFEDVGHSRQTFDDIRHSRQNFDDVVPSRQTFNDIPPSRHTFEDIRQSRQTFGDIRQSQGFQNDIQLGSQHQHIDIFTQQRRDDSQLNQGQILARGAMPAVQEHCTLYFDEPGYQTHKDLNLSSASDNPYSYVTSKDDIQKPPLAKTRSLDRSSVTKKFSDFPKRFSQMKETFKKLGRSVSMPSQAQQTDEYFNDIAKQTATTTTTTTTTTNNLLNDYKWFRGKIPRADAERELQGKEGAFLVKESERSSEEYSLYLCHKEKIHRFRIVTTGGMHQLGTYSEKKFHSIPELVKFYRKTAIILQTSEEVLLSFF